MKQISINGRIIRTTYKSTSYYGNPKYKVWFENLDNKEVLFGETANNAACAYGINNSDLKVKCEITYHFTKSDNLIIDFITPDRNK